MGLTKATITNCETNEQIRVMFNPSEYTVTKETTWKPKPVVGKNVPKMDFTGGGSQTLAMDLFLDALESDGDVRKDVKKLMALTLIHEKPKNDKTKRSRPPLCIFQWGPNWEFKAALTKLAVKYTLFKQDGTPVRATASITLQEAEDEKEKKGTNPTSYGEPGRKRREVRPHDNLPLIAFEEYGDPTLWRHIALENRIDDPLSIRPGQILSIPPRY